MGGFQLEKDSDLHARIQEMFRLTEEQAHQRQEQQLTPQQIFEQKTLRDQQWSQLNQELRDQEKAWKDDQTSYRTRELTRNANDKALAKAKTPEQIADLREERRQKALKDDAKKVHTDKVRHGFYKAVMVGVKFGRWISRRDREEKNTIEAPTYQVPGLKEKYESMLRLRTAAEEQGREEEFELKYGTYFADLEEQYQRAAENATAVATKSVEDSAAALGIELTAEQKEERIRRNRDALLQRSAYTMTFGDNTASNVQGGTKPNAIRYAKDGSRWLVKTNHSCIGAAAPNASIMTVAGYQIQKLVHPETAIEAFETKSQRQGTVSMQRMADHVLNPEKGEVVDLFKFSRTPEAMTKQELQQVQELSPQILREHTTDWLLANFDTKGENFIVSRGPDDQLVLRGIDKEAGGRAILDEGAQHMSKDYRKFDQDTVYNQMFRKFAEGTMDLDLSVVEAQVLRVEQCSDQEYLQIFQQYIDQQKKDRPDDAAQIEKNFLRRKQTLRSEYRRFFGELVRERIKNVSSEQEKLALRDKYLGGVDGGLFLFQSDTAESIKAERQRLADLKEEDQDTLQAKIEKADKEDEKRYNRRHAVYGFSKTIVMGFKKLMRNLGIGAVRDEVFSRPAAATVQQTAAPAQEQQQTAPVQTAAAAQNVRLNLRNEEKVHMGGTKPMSQITAADGSKWLVKDAVNCMGYQKTSGALLTEIGARVQTLVDKQTAVEAFVGTMKKHGMVSFQRRLNNVESGPNKLDLFRFSKHPELATRETIQAVQELMPQILREHVTDWLLCNFDTKGENFVITLDEQGNRVLHGIDKEAAFNNIRKPDAQMMSTTYKPHANNTLYNVAFEKFANAEMEFDLRAVLPYVEKVMAMDDAAYMATFQPYLDHLERTKKPDEVADIKEKILIRKRNLLAEYTHFFTKLVERRCKNVHPDEARELREHYFNEQGAFSFAVPNADPAQ